MPKAAKTVLARKHRVKRLEGPTTPGGAAQPGAAKATPAPRAGGKKAATETVRQPPAVVCPASFAHGELTRCAHQAVMVPAAKKADATPAASGESKVIYIGAQPPPVSAGQLSALPACASSVSRLACLTHAGHIPHGFYEKEMRGALLLLALSTALPLLTCRPASRSLATRLFLPVW